MRIQNQRRRAAVVVESAIILPILITTILAIIVGAFAVFVYQQTASLAREGSRYASVHGYSYSQSTGKAAASDSDIYNNAIAPRIVSMDAANLSYAVSWSPDKRQGSFVTITLTYRLTVPLFGDLILTSSSTEQVHW